jgi:hypothetical protein
MVLSAFCDSVRRPAPVGAVMKVPDPVESAAGVPRRDAVEAYRVGSAGDGTAVCRLCLGPRRRNDTRERQLNNRDANLQARSLKNPTRLMQFLLGDHGLGHKHWK